VTCRLSSYNNSFSDLASHLISADKGGVLVGCHVTTAVDGRVDETTGLIDGLAVDLTG
jgi:hypothetical protein